MTKKLIKQNENPMKLNTSKYDFKCLRLYRKKDILITIT